MLSAAASVSYAQSSAQSTVDKNLNLLRDSQATLSPGALAYSYGLVFGYYVQGRNELKGDLAMTLFAAQDQLKLKNAPSLEDAVYAINQLDSGLGDTAFCLFKGLATGNYFAGNEKSSVALAATADEHRFDRVCR